MRESGVALSSPGDVEFGKSGGFRGVHSGSGLVVSNDRVIVINISLQNTLSGNGISPLVGKSSKLLSPSGDSRVL